MEKPRTSPDDVNQTELPPLHIVYFTDPLCCWSWAFERVWQELLEKYKHVISFRYCMGGLLSSWDQYHDELRSINRPAQMGPLWEEVKHVTGTAIDSRLWTEDPPASSWPACVAVKTAALQSEEAAAAYLRLLRKAVMMERKNIAVKEVLLKVAADAAWRYPAFDYNLFCNQLAGKESTQAFRQDLDETRLTGVTRFPSLLVSAQNNAGKLLLTGYRPFESLMSALSPFNGTQ